MGIYMNIPGDRDYSRIHFTVTQPKSNQYSFSASLSKKSEQSQHPLKENWEKVHELFFDFLEISDPDKPIPLKIYTNICNLINKNKLNFAISNVNNELKVSISEEIT